MWFLTAIFQAIGQAVTWILPVSESGHSSIFHDFANRFSGSCSELTGLVHIGIAIGIVAVFFKMFLILSRNFFGIFSDLFKKQLLTKKVDGSRKFVYMSLLSFLPMVIYPIPAGKYGNVYGLLNYTTYNKTILDDGICFAISGALILFAMMQLKKNLNNKNIDWYGALVLGFAATFALPIAGFSFIGIVFCLAVMMGISKKLAIRFAATLSVPVLVSMGIAEICTAVTYVNIFAGIIGVVLSAVATYFVLKILIWMINNAKLNVFAYYNFGIGAVAVIIGIFELLLR